MKAMYPFMTLSLLCCLVLLLPSITLGQYVIERDLLATASKDTTIGEVNVSYSVGELAAIATFTADDGMTIFTQGFQQFDDILLDRREDLGALIRIKVGPNPFKQFVEIEVHSDKYLELELAMSNALGQDISVPKQREKVRDIWKTRFDLTHVSEGHYFLFLKDEVGQILKTLMLQKIN